MQIFHPSNRDRSSRHRTLCAWAERVYTLVDCAAALCLVAGSLCFAMKSSMRFGRKLRFLAMGDDTDLARRADG